MTYTSAQQEDDDDEEGDDGVYKKTSFFVLVCEVGLGNVYNILDQAEVPKKIPQNFHSLRVMGRRGPNFDQNLVLNDNNGLIAPIGRITDYETPKVVIKNQDFDSINDLISFYEGGERKKKGAGKKAAAKRRPAKKAAKKRSASAGFKRGTSFKAPEDEDVEMIDTSSKPKGLTSESYRAEVKDEKLTLQPHIIHQMVTRNKWDRNRDFYYHAQESQYVVSNSDQVRVKYIVHMQTMRKK